MEADTGDLTLDAIGADVSEAIRTVDGLIDGFFSLIPKLAIAAILLVVFFVLARWIRRVVAGLGERRKHHALGLALGRLAFVAVLFAGLLSAVAVVAPSIGAAELLQLLGVGSVAIGFAFRDVLQNFLAGLLILIRQPFKENDWVIFDGYEGIVEEISTRSTRIRTFDGRRTIVPNGEIYTNPITVVSDKPIIRAQYDFGVGYDSNLDLAVETILAAIRSIETVRSDPAPDAGVIDLAGSSVNIRARWWVRPDDIYGTKLAVLKAVKEALDREGIDIPFPIRTMHLPRPLDIATNDDHQNGAAA